MGFHTLFSRPSRPLAWLLGTVLANTLAFSGATSSHAAELRPAAPSAVDSTETEAQSEAVDFTGLYSGAILYRPGGAELEILVELGTSAAGELVGTIDMPAYDDITFKPLENFSTDGRGIYFSYRHDSEVRGPNALFEFDGELSADGERLSGDFLETRGRIPFELQRLGPPGSDRPEMTTLPLHDLSAGYAELRDAFNAHPDHARLVLLLSPT